MAPTKRKASIADASGGTSSSKKARADIHQDAQALIKAILARPDTYPILDDVDAVRRQYVELAGYARDLEQDLSASESTPHTDPAPKTMTPEQLQAAVGKLRKSANRGVTKSMVWRPSCKTGTAKWTYDGVCTNPLVFGTLIGQDGPPKFKAHKIPVTEFEKLLGGVHGSARYSSLCITGSHVNVRWSDNGEFKFSGSYGKED